MSWERGSSCYLQAKRRWSEGKEISRAEQFLPAQGNLEAFTCMPSHEPQTSMYLCHYCISLPLCSLISPYLFAVISGSAAASFCSVVTGPTNLPTWGLISGVLLLLSLPFAVPTTEANRDRWRSSLHFVLLYGFFHSALAEFLFQELCDF